MSQESLIKCDICKTAYDSYWKSEFKYGHSKDSKIRSITLSVVFLTEQTEGRCTAPYITNTNLDVCKECEQKLIEGRTMLTATGAMGFNEYTIEKRSY